MVPHVFIYATEFDSCQLKVLEIHQSILLQDEILLEAVVMHYNVLLQNMLQL